MRDALDFKWRRSRCALVKRLVLDDETLAEDEAGPEVAVMEHSVLCKRTQDLGFHKLTVMNPYTSSAHMEISKVNAHADGFRINNTQTPEGAALIRVHPGT